MSNVIPMPGSTGRKTPADLFLRVGEANHAQVAQLYAEGALPIARAVFDASRLRHQVEFAKTLRDDNVELTLDTKTGELGAVGKFEGWASRTPWAKGHLMKPSDFTSDFSRQFVRQIAEEAIENGFDRVLSPSHYLKAGVLDPWLQTDVMLCSMLRQELDIAGGQHVAIDYLLIIDQTKLRDEAVREALISHIAELPFDNIHIRLSGFGTDATPTAVRALIGVLDRFHNFGHPVILDHVGGMVSRALLAFGSVSGIAHGVDEHSRFDGGAWLRAKSDDDGEKRGGNTKRVYISDLDRSFTVPELTALAKAKGGRSLIVCRDPNCCRDLNAMIANSRRHSIRQELKKLDAINSIPDLMRPQAFIEGELADLDRHARQVKGLNPVVDHLKPRKDQTLEQAHESLVARLEKHSEKLEKMRSTLENLNKVRGLVVARAPEAAFTKRISRGGR
ncbi:hypothetical protein LY632_06580 [Erythrobacter sp. SDW2]|uniref:hypothetical protein n=1 Tax=Erythrobacter sp. SDW2 TaxID=2907154 RepID=UPI001F1FD082|nr:hypothetical protein [Erythrobacter sp. SDW2]UIP08053.1 hypothetical protein LY632_06580 [Erythrobacter sp. SDW2]